MQLGELKALLTRSDLFAISPTPIDRPLPGSHDRSRSRLGPACPLGLVKATVLETSHAWTEQTTFGCAGKTHPVERKTGVLVRVQRAELEADDVRIDVAKLVGQSPFAELVVDNGNVVQLVVSRRAVLMPWSDYKPTRDLRRRQAREAQRRNDRLNAAVEAIGAKYGHWNYDWDNGQKVYRPEHAEVRMSLARAEEIAALLAERAAA